MSEEVKTATTETTPESKKSKREKMIYPACELAGGIYKSYFSSYLSMLFTNVYMFSTTLTGILETVKSLSSYVISPVSAYIVDHLNFKSGKYWPYVTVCCTGVGIGYIILFSMPVLAADASKLAVLVLILNTLILTLSNLGTNACRQVYARMCKTPKDRSNISMYAKIARDGMKSITGFIYPLVLAALIAHYNDEPKAWAAVAMILAIPAIIIYFVDGLWLKNSQFEKENAQQYASEKQRGVKKKASLVATLKGIISNRHMLCAFFAYALTKLYYFSFTAGGSYTWRYYFEKFGYFSFFSTGCGIAAIVGALSVPTLRRIFKDLQYTWAATVALQAVFGVVNLFTFREDQPVISMVVIFGMFFFNGAADTMSMPAFVGASDWANWKYKTNDVGLTMAIWGLALNLGMLMNTWIRTYILNKGGFDAKALKAGAAIPATLKQTLWSYNTVIPLVLMIGAVLFIMVGYGLKDSEIERCRKENELRIKEGK